MKKWGLFYLNQKEPFQTFEGDYMTQNQEFVQVYNTTANKGDQQVAAIRLREGDCVKEIK